MSQKTIFERIYNIVLLRGGDRAIESINAMYDSYTQLNDMSTFKSEDVTCIKNDFIAAINDAVEYNNDISFRGLTESDKNFRDRQKISKDNLKQDLSIVENKDTVFYGKKVVLTGVFSRYPDRDILATQLRKLGADLNSSISKKTNIVCLGGVGVGPSKMAKITELNSSGNDIKLIEEFELYNIFDSLL